MKKTILLILSLTIAQNLWAKNVAIATRPLLILIGGMNLEVEAPIYKKLSLAGDYFKWQFTFDDYDTTVSTYGATLRYYFAEKALDQGVYTGLGYQFLSVKLKENDFNHTGEATTNIFGLHLGYHWQWDNFFQDLGGQLYVASLSKIKLKDSNNDTVGSKSVPGFSGFGLTYRLGWAF